MTITEEKIIKLDKEFGVLMSKFLKDKELNLFQWEISLKPYSNFLDEEKVLNEILEDERIIRDSILIEIFNGKSIKTMFIGSTNNFNLKHFVQKNIDFKSLKDDELYFFVVYYKNSNN